MNDGKNSTSKEAISNEKKSKSLRLIDEDYIKKGNLTYPELIEHYK